LIEIASAPQELEHQRTTFIHLTERSSILKKRITSQAKLNLLLDKKLQKLNTFDIDTDLNTSFEVKFFCSFSLIDSSVVSNSMHRNSSLMEGGDISLGDRLDRDVKDLGKALADLSGCWINQVYQYVYIYLYICVYALICTCIQMHIFIYIYMYIFV
jgi:hypothetical protein